MIKLLVYFPVVDVYLFNVRVSGCSSSRTAVYFQASASRSSVEMIECYFTSNVGNRSATCSILFIEFEVFVALTNVYFHRNVYLSSNPAVVLIIS